MADNSVRLTFSAGILAAWTLGCATQGHSTLPAATPIGDQTTQTSTHASHHGHHMHFGRLPHRVVNAHDGQLVQMDSLWPSLLASKVIYVGEHHDNPHDHAVQLEVISDMYAHDHDLVIGMEMFSRPFQPYLDDYIAGKIDAEVLQEKTEWDERWGFDFELYRPVLSFAQAHHIRLVALNAPKELTETVAAKGLEALSPSDRDSLPKLDFSNADHRTMSQEAFQAHPGHEHKSFDNFYAVQVIWDETMGDQVARVFSSANPPHHMIVLTGLGHVRYHFGVPARAAKRGATPFKTILPVMLRDLHDELEENAGDYLWVMAVSEDDLPEI